MRFWIAALLLALLGSQTPASAGLETPKPVCDDACTASLRRFADTYMAEHAPMLAALPERFEAAALASGKDCPARQQSGAAVYGVMLGPGEIKGLTKLQGPANDIALIIPLATGLNRYRLVTDGSTVRVDTFHPLPTPRPPYPVSGW